MTDQLRDQIAALFRSAPGAGRLGDEPPGTIADAVLEVVAPLLAERGETEASRRDWAAEADAVAMRYQELLGSLWLYVNWRYVTRQLTTEQKALFADAVDANVGGDPDEDGPRADRWWADPCRPVCAVHPEERR